MGASYHDCEEVDITTLRATIETVRLVGLAMFLFVHVIPLDGAGAGGVLSILLHIFTILYALTSMVSQRGDQSVFVEAHSAGPWPCVQSRRIWKSSLHEA